jgi:transcription factor SOX7/8/10/18 (SOX group E/F)
MYTPQWTPQAQPDSGSHLDQEEETDNAHRPPNAFILYSQAMRSQARQENPSLSNTEVSRLLGKMWKDVPSEIKQQYKQRAAEAQDQFKREHPDYTYRKARRKRALNELLTKSAQGFPVPGGGFPTDPSQMAFMAGAPYLMPGLYGQAGAAAGGQVPPGMAAMGMLGAAQAQIGQLPQQYPSMPGYPGISDPSQGLPGGLYQFRPK